MVEANCNKSKVGEANCSKKMINCSKRKVEKANYCKNIVNSSKNMVLLLN